MRRRRVLDNEFALFKTTMKEEKLDPSPKFITKCTLRSCRRVLDLHKRYSVVSALNEQGQRTREARIDGNSAVGFAQFFKGLW